MEIKYWVVWIVLGILCFILEVFTPTFFFMSIGIGAVFASLLSLVIDSVLVQIATFVAFTFFSFLLLRKVSKKAFDVSTDKTNVYRLVGMEGVVTKEISPIKRGYVALKGEEWSAITEDNVTIPEGTMVTVLAVEGNKVVVKRSSESSTN